MRLSDLVSVVMRAPVWAVGLAAIVIVAGVIGLAILLDDSKVDRIAEPIVLAVVALTAVYFLVRSGRHFLGLSAKARMLMILTGLAALHALGLVSYFTFPFAHQTPRSLAEELYGVDFSVFPLILVLTWALISVLVALRYRGTDGWPDARPRFLSLGICLALAAFAVGISGLFPPLKPIFTMFGADLPSPTLLLNDAGAIWWVLPALGAALLVGLFGTSAHYPQIARLAFDGQIGLLVLANASLVAALGATFLPHYKMCETIRETGFTRLHAAALLGHTDTALRFIDKGVSPDAADLIGWTPLIYATAGNHLGLARELVARGARVDSNTARGPTALHIAAGKGETEFIAWLLEKGARVDPLSSSGGTPLHAAADGGHEETAMLLLDKGAYVNAVNDRGQTPLDLAHEMKESKLAQMLVERGGRRSTVESRKFHESRAEIRAAVAQMPSSCRGV